MPPDASGTREALLVAGRRLFAENGLEAVRLQELVEHAGQRNASAVQYHFGSRWGLVEAIRDRHQESIERDRQRLLGNLDERATTLEQLVGCVVFPAARKLDTRDGRDGLRVVSHIVLHSGTQNIPDVSGPHRAGLRAAFDRIERLLDAVPRPVCRQRLALMGGFITISLADRAVQIERGYAETRTNAAFAAELTAMSVGALRAAAGDEVDVLQSWSGGDVC